MPTIRATYEINWDELRALAKRINEILSPLAGGRQLVICNTRQHAYRCIKSAFDQMAANRPEDWKTRYGIPAQAIELYESFIEEQIGAPRRFIQVSHRFIEEELDGLTKGVIKLLFTFARYADFNNGETFVSNQKVAETANISFRNIDKMISLLKEKGFLINLRRHRSGTWVRKVRLD